MHILVVIGTRPEAIKMAPVIHELRRRDAKVSICSTGQHGDLLQQALTPFHLTPDYDLGVMKPHQGIDQLRARITVKLSPLLQTLLPDLVVVHGDTTSALAGAEAAHIHHIPVAHVEAGLRSGTPDMPWPEEMNRTRIAEICDTHFAPTQQAQNALLNEGYKASAVHLTGNTIVDALQFIRDRSQSCTTPFFSKRGPQLPLVLATLHRRETIGAGQVAICKALREIAGSGHAQIVLPVHPNPAVAKTIRLWLANIPNVTLTQPLEYPAFLNLLEVAALVLTDSGGVQEEAVTLGIATLILRDVTERPEAINSGLAQLVGTDPQQIISATVAQLQNPQSRTETPVFGDGRAAIRIADILLAA